jgi:tRNA threonylcarbamoyladenosine biosynthesis protein TsaE
VKPTARETATAAASSRRTVAVRTSDPTGTRDLGRRLATTLRAGDVVLLHGDLGSGKTTLTQGIASGLGVGSPVQSPTFVLAHEHAARASDGSPLVLHHLDLYRLADDDDAAAFGYEGYLAPADGVTVVEWPERASCLLPEVYVLVELTLGAGNDRLLAISVVGDEHDAKRLLAPFVTPPTPL